MRVGMIGIGGIADVYRKGLVQYNQPIAAVCDINEARVAEVAAATGATGYTDYRAMLANDQLDAVFVSIPPGVHGNQHTRQSSIRCGRRPTAVGLDFQQGAMQSLDEKYLGETIVAA